MHIKNISLPSDNKCLSNGEFVYNERSMTSKTIAQFPKYHVPKQLYRLVEPSP